MFDDHVRAIRKGSWVKDVVVPVLVTLGCLLGVGLVLDVVVQLALAAVGHSDSDDVVTLGGTITMVLQVLATLWVITRLAHVSLHDLGLVRRGRLRAWLTGALAGIVAITVVWAVNYAFGGIAFSSVLRSESLGTLALAVVFFAFQGPYEEILFRSYLQTALTARLGVWPAMVISSLGFMALHGANPNMTPMGWLNLFVFGMVFAVAYWRTGNLWLVGAAHSTWNFFLGDFFGSNTSGNPMPVSVFRSAPVTGQELLSGGVYGMEGSIAATVLGVVMIVGLVLHARRGATR